MKKTIIIAIAMTVSIMLANTEKVSACTGIMLRPADGGTVAARTIEWAAEDMTSYYVVVPRGQVLYSMLPGGFQGRSFKARYGYVGLSVEQKEFMVEGINEKGLSAGLFYFAAYGQYEAYDEDNFDSNISDFQLVSYILGNCADIEDVKRVMRDVHVHGIDPRASTVHWRFVEPGGRQVVLEIIDGKCVYYENELGVLTNSPSFDWHLTNLNNYMNLSPGRVGPKDMGRMQLRSISGGTGLLGLPGDFSSTSRFVRAAFLQSTAPVLANSSKTVIQAFHILNSFDIPIGAQYDEGQAIPDLPSATQFTAVSDLMGRKLYWKTMHNSEIRCIDLSKINFAKVKYISKPLDTKKCEPIHMVELY
jgi:choloylglycine hydrolase